MAMITCPKCSAEIQDTARFCRQCGQAVNPSEATTKFFDPPPQTATPTQGIEAVPTAPSFTLPSFPETYQAHYPAAPATQGFENKGRNKAIIILASLVVVLVLALAGLGAWFIFGGGDRGGPPGFIAIPPQPPGSADIHVPPPPPPPPVPVDPPIAPVEPPAAPGSGGATISNDLIYPGAQETMRVGASGKARVLRLQTDDSIDKVTAWYTQRLNTTKKIVVPGSTILKTDRINVVITGSGDGTQILLTQSNE